jgi:hypothetical protein
MLIENCSCKTIAAFFNKVNSYVGLGSEGSFISHISISTWRYIKLLINVAEDKNFAWEKNFFIFQIESLYKKC